MNGTNNTDHLKIEALKAAEKMLLSQKRPYSRKELLSDYRSIYRALTKPEKTDASPFVIFVQGDSEKWGIEEKSEEVA